MKSKPNGRVERRHLEVVPSGTIEVTPTLTTEEALEDIDKILKSSTFRSSRHYNAPNSESEVAATMSDNNKYDLFMQDIKTTISESEQRSERRENKLEERLIRDIDSYKKEAADREERFMSALDEIKTDIKASQQEISDLTKSSNRHNWATTITIGALALATCATVIVAILTQ
ncbi:hypothetical protein [Geomicrobium sediminis]|uniref:Chromosome segregation ATPase n=1 Tax=Geomicrobium sediminis TaxID=1347788 RepID=A0ABS2PFP1_9BACL|nr:hypothetical protein [Geomicrobium sediminis]MBM7633880.1 chromosome segregation ATPase [Geomicrobium sediminis]